MPAPKTMRDLLQEQRKALTAEYDKITDTAVSHNRLPSPNEEARSKEILAEIDAVNEKITDAVQFEATRAAAAIAIADGQFSHAHSESRGTVYHRESPHSYFRDLAQMRQGDWDARERLQLHTQEMQPILAEKTEYRAISTTTGAGGEFTPPAYLLDEFIAALRPARATADALTNLALPDGVPTINIPKISTGTSTAQQGTQNTAISQTDLTTVNVTSPVITIAGGQQFSVQLLEQSPLSSGIDQLILTDLLADYARQLGSIVINGTGSGGQLTGLLNAGGTTVTYTDATPALLGDQKLYSKIANAVSNIQSARFAPPDTIIMHPRRWAWIAAQHDTANRPAIPPKDGGPMNAPGTFNGDTAQGVAGSMYGCKVVLDPSIPTNLGAGTNQDVILVLRASDSILWESTIRAEVFPQTYANALTMYARVYNYAALAHRYAPSINVISGTGLVAPTF